MSIGLVATDPMALPNFVSVECSATSSHKRANSRALLASRQSPNGSAAYRRSCHRQFVTMLLPKSAMTSMASRLRRSNRAYRPN
jgi:hypothetical protein